jgi:phosphoserine aminotransferase
MKVWQTSYTPNVLGVYLLQKTLEISPSISQTDKLIRTRAKNWYHFFSGKFKNYELLINNSTIQSQTVITVKGDEQAILKLKAKAKKEGLLLGNGYGAWSKNTFRIANFPSISDKEIRTLQKFLHQQLH